MQRPDVASHHIFGGVTSQQRLVRSVLLFYPLLLFLYQMYRSVMVYFHVYCNHHRNEFVFLPGLNNRTASYRAWWRRRMTPNDTNYVDGCNWNAYWRELFLELSTVLTIYNTTFLIQSFVFYTLHLEYCCNAWWHNIKFAV